MKNFLSVCLSFLTVNNDRFGHFGVIASNVDFIPRTIRHTEITSINGLADNQEDSSNVNLLAVLFGDEFQAFYRH